MDTRNYTSTGYDNSEEYVFNRTAWAGGILIFCFMPLFLLMPGVDFSSGKPPLSPEIAANYSAGELKEAVFISLKGSFTHTILEWTAVCTTSNNLPQTMFPNAAIKRPYDMYPLIPYLLCGLVVFPFYYKQHRTLFAFSLILLIIPQTATQLYMALGSFKLHDSCFNIAHSLKAVS